MRKTTRPTPCSPSGQVDHVVGWAMTRPLDERSELYRRVEIDVDLGHPSCRSATTEIDPNEGTDAHPIGTSVDFPRCWHQVVEASGDRSDVGLHSNDPARWPGPRRRSLRRFEAGQRLSHVG